MDGELEAVFVFRPLFTTLFYSPLIILGTRLSPSKVVSSRTIRKLALITIVLNAKGHQDLLIHFLDSVVPRDVDQYPSFSVEVEQRRGLFVIDL